MPIKQLAAAFFGGVVLCAATARSQDVTLSPPKQPIAINAYALLNTTVGAQTNTAPTATNPDGSINTTNGTQVIAGGQGFCCGSRLGLSGAAALGHDIGAVFQVETGFLFNTGALDQQGQIFGRQAYAGLVMGTGHIYNVLAVGRQYDVAFVSTSAFDPYGHGSQILTAWDTAFYGGRFDNSIQDILTVGTAKIMLQYSPGGIPGSAGSGTTLGGGVVYQVKPFIVGGTTSHSQDAYGHGLDVYGAGLRYAHGPLTFYSYGYDTRRDPGFTPAAKDSGGALANTDIIPNTNNPFRREDRYGNFSVRYDLHEVYSLIGMYKFDKAISVNAQNAHGTEATYMMEGARGVTKDFFLYAYVAYTKLTGAERTDPYSPNGTFAGASSRTYGGVGLNYRFNVNLK